MTAWGLFTYVQSNVIGIRDSPEKPPKSWFRTTLFGLIPGENIQPRIRTAASNMLTCHKGKHREPLPQNAGYPVRIRNHYTESVVRNIYQ
jgi:hypothetical protein